jgi:hypothetical protein
VPVESRERRRVRGGEPEADVAIRADQDTPAPGDTRAGGIEIRVVSMGAGVYQVACDNARISITEDAP